MARFAELSVAQFLDALASPEPTPGGGTAAAIAAAIGTALLTMVASLPKTRNRNDDDATALAAARAAIGGSRDRFLTLADVDSEAFNLVMAAFRLPKTTEAERESRTHAIQKGLRAATEAPLETLRVVADVVAQGAPVAMHGNPSAESDVRAALELLEAAAAAAAANVEINLANLEDEPYRKATAEAAVELGNRVTEACAAARGTLART